MYWNWHWTRTCLFLLSLKTWVLGALGTERLLNEPWGSERAPCYCSSFTQYLKSLWPCSWKVLGIIALYRGQSAATYPCEEPPAWVRGPFLSQSPFTDIPRCDYGHPGNKESGSWGSFPLYQHNLTPLLTSSHSGQCCSSCGLALVVVILKDGAWEILF